MILNSIFTTVIAAAVLAFPKTAAYAPGDQVEDFSLKNVDGKMVSMSADTTVKGYIVVFTCNHCPYAKAYESRVMDLDKKYRSKGWPVIAINANDSLISSDDSYTSMQKRSKDKGYTFPYLLDETQSVARKFGATKTPHVYLVQRENGKYFIRYIGAIDDNSEDENAVKEKYVENAIEAVNAGKTPEKPETKAIGCTIKWRKN